MDKPGKIPSVADKAREVLGGELGAEEIAALVLFARKVGNDNIKMGPIPTRPASHYNLELDELELPKTLKQYGFMDPGRTTFNYTR